MNPLLDACLAFESKGYFGNSRAMEIEISNTSDARFMLQNTSAYEFYEHNDLIEVLPHSKTRIKVLTDSVDASDIQLTFEVLNAVIAKKTNANITAAFAR